MASVINRGNLETLVTATRQWRLANDLKDQFECDENELAEIIGLDGEVADRVELQTQLGLRDLQNKNKILETIEK